MIGYIRAYLLRVLPVIQIQLVIVRNIIQLFSVILYSNGLAAVLIDLLTVYLDSPQPQLVIVFTLLIFYISHCRS